jgi:hypothetical protein
MVAILHTGNLQVTHTEIRSRGKLTNVLISDLDDLELKVYWQFAPALLGNGYNFRINHRILEPNSNEFYNHYFNGALDSIGGTSVYFWIHFSEARHAGVRKTRFGYFENPDDGLYVYRPYVIIDVAQLDESGSEPELVFSGASEFAVAEEHHLLVETGWSY